ncbi:MAG: FmdB family transcriptional regulator [Microbacterium sp.]|nr:MAG: FmdB family transcriptional regulator [Microbacterium sp.]
MPTYAYACKQCGHRFDAVQSFSDAALTECPECGGQLRKQFGTVGVTFNGSGFYRTDSRSGSSSSGSSSGGAASGSASSKSEAKSSPASAGS